MTVKRYYKQFGSTVPEDVHCRSRRISTTSILECVKSIQPSHNDVVLCDEFQYVSFTSLLSIEKSLNICRGVLSFVLQEFHDSCYDKVVADVEPWHIKLIIEIINLPDTGNVLIRFLLLSKLLQTFMAIYMWHTIEKRQVDIWSARVSSIVRMMAGRLHSWLWCANLISIHIMSVCTGAPM